MIGAIPAVIIGGVTYKLVEQKAPPESTEPGKTNYKTSYGSTVQQQISGQAAQPSSSAPKPSGSTTGSSVPGLARARAIAARMPLTQTTSWNYASGTPNIDPELQQKLDEIEAYAKKQFENMNDVEKGAAADYLNKSLKLDPPLSGHEKWEAISAAVGGAGGNAVGEFFGGPAGGKVGALAGAYLGAKLEDLIEKNLPALKSWLKDKWGDISGEVKKVAGEVEDFFKGLF